nr:FCD domain-containing protein [Rhodococcus sp. (in: high G+C Gram-positive bacteria)]
MTTSHLRPIDRAVGELVRRITDDEWPVGSTLPSETALAAELSLGRSTVREAIRELAAKGLVRSRQGAGVYVLSTTMPTDVAATVRRASYDDVAEVRIIVEVNAAELAAQRRTPADLDRLSVALEERHRCAALSDDEFVDADIQFHGAVVDSAHNPVLADLFATFVPRLRAALIDYTRDVISREPGAEPDVDLHRELFDAISVGDARAARDAVRRHLGIR